MRTASTYFSLAVTYPLQLPIPYSYLPRTVTYPLQLLILTLACPLLLLIPYSYLSLTVFIPYSCLSLLFLWRCVSPCEHFSLIRKYVPKLPYIDNRFSPSLWGAKGSIRSPGKESTGGRSSRLGWALEALHQRSIATVPYPHRAVVGSRGSVDPVGAKRHVNHRIRVAQQAAPLSTAQGPILIVARWPKSPSVVSFRPPSPRSSRGWRRHPARPSTAGSARWG